MAQPNKIPTYVKFEIAGISGVAAASFVHPLDLLKNHMQMSGIENRKRTSTLTTALNIYKTGGIRSFYIGLTAGYLRQATYGTCRIGTYMWLQEKYMYKYNMPPALHEKVILGSIAGFCGSLVGTPSEVVLIRMTSDSKLSVTSRRNYSNAMNAVKRIAQEEGISALWRGFSSTMARAVVANAAELSSYSQCKHYLLSSKYFEDNFITHIISSTVAALCNLSVSLPIDIAKTRIQNMKVIENECEGPIAVIKRILKNEGPTALWKGFSPSFACIAPRTILVFIFVEYLSKYYNIHILKDPTNTSSGL